MPESIATLRRVNATALFQRFVAQRIAAGDPPKGLEAAFAATLEMSPSTWNMAKTGARPIGDRLARQIEGHCGVPAGWLDEAREPDGPSAGEQQFLSLALKAYRATNAEGRRQLRRQMRELADGQAAEGGPARAPR